MIIPWSCARINLTLKVTRGTLRAELRNRSSQYVSVRLCRPSWRLICTTRALTCNFTFTTGSFITVYIIANGTILWRTYWRYLRNCIPRHCIKVFIIALSIQIGQDVRSTIRAIYWNPIAEIWNHSCWLWCQVRHIFYLSTLNRENCYTLFYFLRRQNLDEWNFLQQNVITK